MCVSEFQWLAPRGGPPDPASFTNPRNDDSNPLTVVAINGTTIGNNLIIDLWAEKKNVHDRVSRRLHKLEAIGVKTAGLIIDFSDSDRPNFTAIDRLIFDRVYGAQAVCDAGTNSQAADGQKS